MLYLDVISPHTFSISLLEPISYIQVSKIHPETDNAMLSSISISSPSWAFGKAVFPSLLYSYVGHVTESWLIKHGQKLYALPRLGPTPPACFPYFLRFSLTAGRGSMEPSETHHSMDQAAQWAVLGHKRATKALRVCRFVPVASTLHPDWYTLQWSWQENNNIRLTAIQQPLFSPRTGLGPTACTNVCPFMWASSKGSLNNSNNLFFKFSVVRARLWQSSYCSANIWVKWIKAGTLKGREILTMKLET